MLVKQMVFSTQDGKTIRIVAPASRNLKMILLSQRVILNFLMPLHNIGCRPRSFFYILIYIAHFYSVILSYPFIPDWAIPCT